MPCRQRQQFPWMIIIYLHGKLVIQHPVTIFIEKTAIIKWELLTSNNAYDYGLYDDYDIVKGRSIPIELRLMRL